MKRTLTLALLACTAMILTGCMSDAQVKSAADSYKEFVRQERSMELQTVEFADQGGTVTLTNVKRFTTRAPLDKLSIVPDNPGTAREVVDGVVKIGAIAATYYGVKELAGSKGNTTINNAAATP